MLLPQHIPFDSAKQRGDPDKLRAGAWPAFLSAGSPHREPVRSLYIHVPFCSHKCHYCDFYSFVDTRDQQGAFVERLISELTALAPLASGAPLRTVFIGGGTPSMLRIDLWSQLLTALADRFDLGDIRGAGAGDEPEFTVECNPETASLELMHALRAGGVNRVSLGAQSFNPAHLATLQRIHDPESVGRALEHARTAGIPRQSIDLIYAVPGQTVHEWIDDLDRAARLGTTHLSAYNLTYEPNTAMTQRLRLGQFKATDDDIEAAMHEAAVERLAAAGLRRYEVSNFAAPGHESRHNLAYWLQEQWLAAGPSASGHLLADRDARAGSHRWKNIPRLGDYLASAAGCSPVVDHEAPDPLRLIRERLMTGLRLARGIDAARLLDDVRALAPRSVERLRARAEQVRARGHLAIDGDHAGWTLTEPGFLFADGIAAELMGCVRSE